MMKLCAAKRAKPEDGALIGVNFFLGLIGHGVAVDTGCSHPNGAGVFLSMPLLTKMNKSRKGIKGRDKKYENQL